MKIDAGQRLWQRRMHKAAALARLAAVNRLSRRPVTGTTAVVCSVTSYGPRLSEVGYAIESVAQGSVRPRRFILWLDEEIELSDYPLLRRLQRRGLEIRSTENYGPHKKSYPYCRDFADDGVALVTLDDDLLYPRRWLEELVRAGQRHSTEFVGYRGHRVEFDDDGSLAPYLTWGAAPIDRPSRRVFLTGGAGAYFPPALQAAIRASGEAFTDVCPRADDIWINVQALRAGLLTRAIHDGGMSLLSIPRSQATVALHRSNVTEGGNDTQLAATYGPADLSLLRADES